MELNPGTLASCADYLLKTLSPDPLVRKPAEESLRSVETQKNYPILLLTLIGQENGDLATRVAGAISFKNYVKKFWKVVRLSALAVPPSLVSRQKV